MARPYHWTGRRWVLRPSTSVAYVLTQRKGELDDSAIETEHVGGLFSDNYFRMTRVRTAISAGHSTSLNTSHDANADIDRELSISGVHDAFSTCLLVSMHRCLCVDEFVRLVAQELVDADE